MTPRKEFHPLQAVEIARAFREERVEYLFLGKGGAILLGFPGTTQDVDVFPEKSIENGERIIRALLKIGFEIDEDLARDIRSGKDFVQIKSGPFDVDLVFAPDGLPSFQEAKDRGVVVGDFQVARLADIIASKRASKRQKDLVDLPLLEAFREEYERRFPRPLKDARQVADERGEKEEPAT